VSIALFRGQVNDKSGLLMKSSGNCMEEISQPS
jgi:hypothetical protein